jgi:hypothetical protein
MAKTKYTLNQSVDRMEEISTISTATQRATDKQQTSPPNICARRMVYNTPRMA